MQLSMGRCSLLAPSKRCRRAREGMITRAAFQGAGPLAQARKVVGMGSCGVDYLASVAAYPKPDEKLRTDQLEVQGGGNAANALTAAARLGLRPTLVSKIGGDGLGDGIIKELRADGVDTHHIMRAQGHPSPFTYIIVDRAGGTRTCIHTPGAPTVAEEMTPSLIAEILQDAELVYFDGRLAEAALLLAQAAREACVPVLVEAERLRPNLEPLLDLADYVVTSAHFPQDFTGESVLEDAILATALKLPRARFIATTLGTRGSLLIERPTQATAAAGNQQGPGAAAGVGAEGEAVRLVDVVQQLGAQLAVEAQQGQEDCVTTSGLGIRRGSVTSTATPLLLTFSAARDAAAVAAQAGAAAQRAAALNADAGNAAGYQAASAGPGGRGVGTAVADRPQEAGLVATVTRASIAQLDKAHVADTTGAGDAFIGSVVYGLVTGMPRPAMLQLAALVAAAKCTQLGARPGLPKRSQLAPCVL